MLRLGGFELRGERHFVLRDVPRLSVTVRRAEDETKEPTSSSFVIFSSIFANFSLISFFCLLTCATATVSAPPSSCSNLVRYVLPSSSVTFNLAFSFEISC